MYYQWPNGSLSLVPNGGLTVYYPARGGDGNQTQPDWQAFPPGLRILGGDPYRRSFNKSRIADLAINYACLSTDSPYPQTNNFPTDKWRCQDGLRTQVWFPMCWDGKNLDSANHYDHMSYPLERPDGGNCPPTHPVRIPGIFYEVLYSVDLDKFPHGNGHNPFVWACGDPTGYGLHGDFLNGWDQGVVQAALRDPSCQSQNTNEGNSPQNCKPLSPYVKSSNPDQSCLLASPIPNIEDVGVNHLIDHLPGCNPVDPGPNEVNPCFGQKPVTIPKSVRRVLLRSTSSGKYVSGRSIQAYLTADTVQEDLSYINVFDIISTGVDGIYTIQSEINYQYWSANNRDQTPINANRPRWSTWETWNLTFAGASQDGFGTAAIFSFSDNLYVQLNGQSQLIANAPAFAKAELFEIINANANVADTWTKTPPAGYVGHARPHY